jgi:hypothetical protein
VQIRLTWAVPRLELPIGLRTSLRCIESMSTSDHRPRIASVSVPRSMRHPPAAPSTTAKNVIARVYQMSVTRRRSAVT